MPAYVDSGLNLVHVDDVATGHLLAAERGQIGRRYVLGGEDVTLGQMLADIAARDGMRVPQLCTKLYDELVAERGESALVVVDVAFTETAALAHYVLPASSQYEKCEFTLFNFDAPHNMFHVRAPVLAPLPLTVSVVTACVKWTSTSCPSTDADCAGIVICPAASAPEGRTSRKTLPPATKGVTCSKKPDRFGASYWVIMSSAAVSSACSHSSSVVSVAFASAPSADE